MPVNDLFEQNPQDLHDSEWLNTVMAQVGLEEKSEVFGNVLSPFLAFR